MSGTPIPTRPLCRSLSVDIDSSGARRSQPKLGVPWQAPHQGAPQSPLVRRELLDNEGPHCPPTEVASKNLNTSAARPVSHSRDIAHVPSELDVISSDSIDSVREQLCQVNQGLDEIQRKYVKSKEEVGESFKGGSLFVPEIQDKPITPNFHLPSLESYDGNSDPSEHVAAFRAQMALYDTSDSLMYRAFPDVCHNLKNQIEDLIRQEHLHRYVRDQQVLPNENRRRDWEPSPWLKGLIEK
ncbi:hypothetical protein BHM03_00026873 [Ensete ventricosum]|nr:hypothetical protein BHM03_00026873 [Ensete ventricosum]